MSSASSLAAAAALVAIALVASTHAAGDSAQALRVCADPNNLPFSNAHGEGFENVVAQLVGKALGRPVEYFWQPQRRAFFRTTLEAGNCDVVMNVPARLERGLVTRPYYRSAYVFVTKRERHLDIRSFDDPRLRQLRIGIQVTGDDYDNPPPAQALASRQLLDHLRGYTVYGDYSKPEPQRAIIDAVGNSDVDVAVVWGPLAGYFAKQTSAPLTLTVAVPQPGVDRPFAFDMSAAVRRDDRQLHDALNAALERHALEIHAILRRYGVPLIARGRPGPPGRSAVGGM